MTVQCLRQKRFESDQEKVHQELVDYFVNLDTQRKSWFFTHSINVQAESRHYSFAQVERLILEFSRNFGIRAMHVDAAIAFNPFLSAAEGAEEKSPVKNNVIPLKRKDKLADENFKEQLLILHHLIEKKIFEFREVLDLVLALLGKYPAAKRVLA